MKSSEHTIQILPQKRAVSIPAGLTLMEALMRNGIFLRNDCGGTGSCGKCRVNIVSERNEITTEASCQYRVDQDISIEIPESAMASFHIMDKAGVHLPPSFSPAGDSSARAHSYGAAVDLGTTTIAVYLCHPGTGQVVSSVALKNPQSLYGPDVMSRITAVGNDLKTLDTLQAVTIGAIQWGLKRLLASAEEGSGRISGMVVVGNPTMIHILTGTDPAPIGVAPYQPAFREVRQMDSGDLGFDMPDFSIGTLPNAAGFLGGDILAAAQAADMDEQPDGTLLVDLGTNGELLLKKGDTFFATSCATGPAFEGASLSCGIQAIPGAVNGVSIGGSREVEGISTVSSGSSGGRSPGVCPGICGAGVINAVAEFCRKGVVEKDGRFALKEDRFELIPENRDTGQASIYISQKDIRSVQLGKSALITGIEFLLKAAGMDRPEKLIVAGAFGTYLSASDLICLGMIPDLPPDRIITAGNLAGAGAVMAVSNPVYIDRAREMAEKLEVIDLACNAEFQQAFVDNLRFP